jgi:hypothetical protein
VAPDAARVVRATPERLTELARGIVRNDYLVVDDDPVWATSMLMLAAGFTDAEGEIGLILVPVAPHLGGYWINGKAPGVTVTCTLVHRDDVDELNTRMQRMWDALYDVDGDR